MPEHSPSLDSLVTVSGITSSWRLEDARLLDRHLWTATQHGLATFNLIFGVLFAILGLCIGDVLDRLLALAVYKRVSGLHQHPTEPSNAYPTSEENATEQQALKNRSQYRKARFTVRITGLLLATTIAIIQVYSVPLTGPKVALSASTTCGVFSLAHNASPQDRDLDDDVQAGKERRAGDYMHDCYSKRSETIPNNEAVAVDPDRCSFFRHQEIDYDINNDQECPFVDHTVCLNSYGAVEFVTPYVPAHDLGLNADHAATLRRRTVCTPLSMDTKFVDANGSHYPILYRYGGTDDDPHHTFAQYGDPFQWGISAYAVTAVTASPYEDENYWHPDPKYLSIKPWGPAPKYTQLTILFIETGRIFYTGLSNDAIFGRDQQRYPPDPDYFRNTDRRAKPLACVDWHEVCRKDGICSDLGEASDLHEIEHEYLRHALRHSNTFSSLRYRLGTALFAQEKVQDVLSRPLSDKQWIYESQALFETSLARIQYNVFDIAIGLGHDKGSYREEDRPWARGNMCNRYIFKLPSGYDNISVRMSTIGIVLLLLLCALRMPTLVKYDDEHKRTFIGGRLQLWELIFRGFRKKDKSILPNADHIDNQPSETTRLINPSDESSNTNTADYRTASTSQPPPLHHENSSLTTAASSRASVTPNDKAIEADSGHIENIVVNSNDETAVEETAAGPDVFVVGSDSVPPSLSTRRSSNHSSSIPPDVLPENARQSASSQPNAENSQK